MAFLNVQGIIDYFNSLFSFVASEEIPISVNPTIQPVININPFGLSQNIAKSVTTPSTIYTTSSTLDFYLTSIILTVSGGVGGGGQIQIKAVINGVNTLLLSQTYQKSTDMPTLSINLVPLHIDKNTQIVMSDTTNFSAVSNCLITGFTFNANATGQQLSNY